MAKIIFRLQSVSSDEADDVKNLLTDHGIEFYESPPGNWGISMHALWLNDDSQYDRAKRLIDDYQAQRIQRVRLEQQQLIDSGEHETFVRRLLQRPFQVLATVAVILLILYVSIMPFIDLGG